VASGSHLVHVIARARSQGDRVVIVVIFAVVPVWFWVEIWRNREDAQDRKRKGKKKVYL